jgi:hypothetical protein
MFRRNITKIAGQPLYDQRFAFQVHYCGNLNATHCSDGCVTSDKETFWRLNNILNEDSDNYLVVVEGGP